MYNHIQFKIPPQSFLNRKIFRSPLHQPCNTYRLAEIAQQFSKIPLLHSSSSFILRQTRGKTFRITLAQWNAPARRGCPGNFSLSLTVADLGRWYLWHNGRTMFSLSLSLFSLGAHSGCFIPPFGGQFQYIARLGLLDFAERRPALIRIGLAVATPIIPKSHRARARGSRVEV